MLTRSQATLFRRWTLGQPDDAGLASGRPEEGSRAAGAAAPHLERIAALVALDGTMPAFQREVNAALAAGASVDDVIGVLRSVTSVVGSARAMAAAPRIALALGYDVEAELELLTPFRDD
jgi:hypothetical protein